jgi:hypothetical protein
MKNLLERIKSLYENPKEFAKDLGKKALEYGPMEQRDQYL